VLDASARGTIAETVANKNHRSYVRLDEWVSAIEGVRGAIDGADWLCGLLQVCSESPWRCLRSEAAFCLENNFISVGTLFYLLRFPGPTITEPKEPANGSKSSRHESQNVVYQSWDTKIPIKQFYSVP
jgi:hypothetical protein